MMKRHGYRLFLATMFSLLFAAFASAAPMTEQQKIGALIHSIEVLPGAKFIRNGSSYDGKQAADHLRTKLSYAGSKVKTAEQFITYVASGSSMSGQAYQIQLADGKKIPAEAFFHAELKILEAPPAAASNASASNASPASTPSASK